MLSIATYEVELEAFEILLARVRLFGFEIYEARSNS